MEDAPYLNDIVYVEDGDQRYYVFVDPLKGQVTGSTTVTFQRFFQGLSLLPIYAIQSDRLFHRTGFCLLPACINGYPPVFFTKKWWNKLFELKSEKGPLVLFRSLHRVVGLWTVPFALLISITGIWYFIERTNIAKVSDISNPSAPKLKEKEHTFDRSISISYQLDYDQAADLAKKEIPGLRIGGIVPGGSLTNPIYFRGKSEVPLVRKRSNRVYIDPVTHEVVGVQKAEEIPTTMYLNDIADPLHFGNWGGLTTKIIWFVGGLAICGLILSGIWIALKRQAKQVVEKGMKVLGIWKYLNWALTLFIVGYMYYFMIARYALPISSLIIVSSILVLLGTLAWYIFDYRLKNSVK
ncbi:PepSY-associated TM helix domain-containing protein [Algoriphagus boritolerans]|uniref:PepSY-associated TM helix domain-containing protein n=1 Tax=Algoriphagus boritolerans TaxID=308111 RepID=UPI000A6CCBAB